MRGIRLAELLALSILFTSILFSVLLLYTNNSFADSFGPLRPCTDLLKDLGTNGCHQCDPSEVEGCTKTNGYIFKKNLSCCTEKGRFDVDGYSYSEYQCKTGLVICCALLGNSGIPDSRCAVPATVHGSEIY